jgi:CHAT domain-containing protein
MELKSALVEGDLFLSYWLGGDLTVLAGDLSGIHVAETLHVPELRDLAAAIVAQVTVPEQYACFVHPSLRERSLPETAPVPSGPALPDLMRRLAPLLVPPAVRELAGRSWRRLVVFPDGILNALPIHLSLEAALGKPWPGAFPDGILYSPSASAYVYARAKRRLDPPRLAAVLVGDEADEGLMAEAHRVASHLPCDVRICTRRGELERLGEADLVYVATHGGSPPGVGEAGEESSGPQAGWSLLFDGGALRPADFFSERVKLGRGSIVVLSACSVGHLRTGPAHELSGLVQSVFFAGAATVLAARWPIFYETAEAVFAGAIENAFGRARPLGAAFTHALSAAMERDDLRGLGAGPDAEPFLWGPFALFGCGD